MSGYAIVQWNWGNGLSVSTVPEKWIISVNGKLKCYFPKSRNAAKAVKEQHDVRADWQLFDVRKLSSKSIKNYDTALSKEDKARFTSELDSNSDSETSLNITKCDKTRNRRRPNYLDAYTDGIEETALGKKYIILLQHLFFEFLVKFCVVNCSKLVYYNSFYHMQAFYFRGLD